MELLFLWSIVVDHFGGAWRIVEDCGALWSELEHLGAFWSIVGDSGACCEHCCCCVLSLPRLRPATETSLDWIDVAATRDWRKHGTMAARFHSRNVRHAMSSGGDASGIHCLVSFHPHALVGLMWCGLAKPNM